MTLTEKGPVLVATEADDIGADLTVSARFGTCPAPVVGRVRTRSRNADLAQVRAVCWRRPTWPTCW